MSTEPTKPAAVNPLAKFFRTASIYVTLPSGGRYWPEGAVEIPENGEIPIFPLTNRDEITLRTPDALMNGQGVVDVIHSCVPAIKDAWQMPSIDVDSTLIAIRIASYGHSMEFDSKCPKCKAEHSYALDLRHMMSSIRCPDYEQLLDLEKVKIKFKPQNYLHTSHIGKVGFEIQKLQQSLDNMDLDNVTQEQDEMRRAALSTQLERLATINQKVLTDSTAMVVAVGREGEQDIQVTDPAHIIEFYSKLDCKTFNLIQAQLNTLQQEANIKPVPVNCQTCNEEMDLTILFDYSNFFVVGS